MYTTVEFDNAVYVIWHNGLSGSPVVIHHFAPGSSVIVNTYITPVFYRETPNGEMIDIYNSEKEIVDGFLSKAFSLNFSDISQYVTDDFAAYTFWGGKQDAETLPLSGQEAIMDFYSKYDSSLARTTLAKISNNVGVVDHGRWTTTNANGETTEVGSNLNIFYFDAAAETIEDRKIQTGYFYQSTPNMVSP